MKKIARLVWGCAPFILGAASLASAEETARFGGFYAGGHVGYAYGAPGVAISGSEDGSSEIEKVFDITPDQRNNAGDPCTLASCRYARDGVFGGRIGSDADGFLGGAHLGYNLQIKNVVFGIEGDYEFGDISGSGKGLIEPKSGSLYTGQSVVDAPAYLTAKSSLENLASLRGRVGFTSGSLLLYGTGGVAWVDFDGSVTSPDGFAHPANPAVPNESGTLKFSDSMVGWVAGGGIEYLLSDGFSIRVEALHYDFGSVDFSGEDVNNIEQMVGKQDVKVNQARVGISYHLN